MEALSFVVGAGLTAGYVALMLLGARAARHTVPLALALVMSCGVVGGASVAEAVAGHPSALLTALALGLLVPLVILAALPPRRGAVSQRARERMRSAPQAEQSP